MDRLVALEQLGAGGDGVVGDHRAEVATPDDVAVARVHRMVRPLQLELPSHPGRPQAVVAVEPVEAAARPISSSWCTARGQPVTARLPRGERLALDDGYVVALAGEPVAGGGAGRPTADDEHVGDDVASVGRVGGQVGGGGLVDDDGIVGDVPRLPSPIAGLGRAALGGASPMSMISAALPSASVMPAVSRSASGVPARGGGHRRLLRAPQLVLLGYRIVGRIRSVQGVALVTDDGEDLGVGEVAACGGPHGMMPNDPAAWAPSSRLGSP